jgi:peptidoglycan/xylan/chitin deacetylase (PgdA/CDA1 family)
VPTLSPPPAAPRPWAPRQLLRQALAFLPRRLLLVRGPARGNAVCLTFDDGPHPEHTPRLLDALKAEEVPATFFVIGRAAERYPELVRRMVAEGHAVGHHSYNHGEPAETSGRQLAAEALATRALLTSLLGQSPPWLFRPPKGKLTAGKLCRLWAARETVVLWDVDPKDYARQSADELRAWFRDHPLRGGSVVLMHDNHPHAAAVVPDLVATARRVGLRFTTIPEWLT